MTRVNPWLLGGIAVVMLVACFGVLLAIVPSDSVTRNTPEPVMAVGPPLPSPDARTAYLAELDAIDPEIVHGKPDQAISRGRDQCTSITQWPDDRTRLVSLVQRRFTSPEHPHGFGVEKSSRILNAVHRHLCP